MLNYINGFSIAADEERKTFIINMLQEFPEITEDGVLCDHNKTQVIGTYLFDRDVALRLSSSILNILNNDDNSEAEDD